jgi:hypothetical protein
LLQAFDRQFDIKDIDYYKNVGTFLNIIYLPENADMNLTVKGKNKFISKGRYLELSPSCIHVVIWLLFTVIWFCFVCYVFLGGCLYSHDISDFQSFQPEHQLSKCTSGASKLVS